MANQNRMANRAANNYMNAITAAFALRGFRSKRKIENLIKAINRMYNDQISMMNELSSSEDNIAELEIPDFISRRRIG